VQRANGDKEGPWSGLNEGVVEKRAHGHTVHLDVDFDDIRFTTYSADGLIVATPTGSTAYSMSARGPIVQPTHSALLFTPVSPHTLFDRALVLDPTTSVRITVSGDRDATLSVDGRAVAQLDPGDAVIAMLSKQPTHLVSFGRRPFHQVLTSKFGLAQES
jgi:NAD+ kinase